MVEDSTGDSPSQSSREEEGPSGSGSGSDDEASGSDDEDYEPGSPSAAAASGGGGEGGLARRQPLPAPVAVGRGAKERAGPDSPTSSGGGSGKKKKFLFPKTRASEREYRVQTNPLVAAAGWLAICSWLPVDKCWCSGLSGTRLPPCFVKRERALTAPCPPRPRATPCRLRQVRELPQPPAQEGLH